MIEVEGTVQRSPLGLGAWALHTADTTYEIYQGEPADIQQEGLTIRAQGRIRDDVMTIAMIGPVLEITRFEAT